MMESSEASDLFNKHNVCALAFRVRAAWCWWTRCSSAPWWRSRAPAACPSSLMRWVLASATPSLVRLSNSMSSLKCTTEV